MSTSRQLFSLLLLFGITLVTQGQAPQLFSYQAVVRDASENLVVATAVGVRLSILQGSASGTAVYVETHTPVTNANGLFSVAVGEGIVESGSMADIDWSAGPYHLRSEVDPEGGTTYTITGTSQLLSVPYALYAASSGTPGPAGLSAHEIWLSLGNLGSEADFLASLVGPPGPQGDGLPDGTATNQLLYWNGTEWATLAPGSNGQVLTVCNDVLVWTVNGLCPDAIGSLDCGSAVNIGAILSGLPAQAVSSVVPYSGGNGEPFPGQVVNSTGVTGLTATLLPDTLASGSGTLTYVITGTPASTGIASFELNVGGQSCSLERLVGSGGGSVTDADGNQYATVVIGPLEWTTTDLRATSYANGDPIPFIPGSCFNCPPPPDWGGLTTGARGSNLGVDLYNWYAVTDPRNVCPSGWRAPTDQDWQTLEASQGMLPGDLSSQGWRGDAQNVGGRMRTPGSQFWQSPNAGATNESNFSGRQGTYRFTDGEYYGFLSNFGHWWSASELDQDNGWERSLSGFFQGVQRSGQFKAVGYPVRCVRDAGAVLALDCATAVHTGGLLSGLPANGVSSSVSYSGGNGEPHNGQTVSSTGVTGLTATVAPGFFASTGQLVYTITGVPSGPGVASFALSIGGQSCTLQRSVADGEDLNPDLTYGSVTDVDGNTYPTVLIGTQEWMAQNLRTTRYSNGDVIPEETDDAAWTGLTAGAWSHFGNQSTNGITYGKIYNGFVISDPRNVCPGGWHVPSEAEWQALETGLGMPAGQLEALGPRGGAQNVGGKLKSTGTQLWVNLNDGATNESGFSAVPGGFRSDFNGSFANLGYVGFWWSSTEAAPGSYWRRDLSGSGQNVIRYATSAVSGLSVRCVRD